MTGRQQEALTVLNQGLLTYENGLFMPVGIHPSVVNSLVRRNWATVIKYRLRSGYRPKVVQMTAIGWVAWMRETFK